MHRETGRERRKLERVHKRRLVRVSRKPAVNARPSPAFMLRRSSIVMCCCMYASCNSNEGRALDKGVSHCNTPSSTSRPMARAIHVLLTEPIWNNVRELTGVLAFVTPMALISTT